MKIFQENVFKELSKSCNTDRQRERLPQKYTFQYFVSFYKHESEVQDHSLPQGLQVVLKLFTHLLNEHWLMPIMCQTPCYLPLYVISSNPHFILILIMKKLGAQRG